MRKKITTKTGFTIIELLVSLAIIVALSAVVLWNQSEATRSINIANAVNEFIIRLREAQTYGVSVKVVDDTSAEGETYKAGYGIYLRFDTNYIILFADKDNDGHYDGTETCQTGAAYECLDKYTLIGGVKIIDMCGQIANSDNIRCARKDGEAIDAFSIVYTRPSLETKVQFYHGNGAAPNSYKDGRAVVMLGYEVMPVDFPPPDPCRAVNVYETGQITSTEPC